MHTQQRQPKKIKYAELNVGDEASFQEIISTDKVRLFADLSGDFNSLHVDADYAATTEFKKPIAHGMIGGALVSRLLGMELPGLYCLYLSQNLTFNKPIFYDTVVIVRGKVIQKVDALKIVKIEVKITDEAGSLLITGEALVKLLQ